MRALRLIPMLSLLLALGTTYVHAQNLGEFVIPFDFTIGEKTLPAGDYAVRSFTIGKVAIGIQNRQNNGSAMALTHAVQDHSNLGQAKMVFHRYGSRHFLSQVWSGDSVGREFRKHHDERSLAMSRSHRQDEVVLAHSF